MPRIPLDGKPIAITGASSGIGAATALACAAAGMPVALGARRLDRLGALAERIRALGGRALAHRVDVTDEGSCRELVERTVAEFGSIYAVYANAGYGHEVPMHRMTDADLRAIFEANFFGSMHVIRAALARMIPARAGHVLLCSSALSRLSIPNYGAYCATKAAQNHVGRAMGMELRPLGIHVSVVLPVRTRTEFADQARAHSPGDAPVYRTPDSLLQSPERGAARTVACLRRPRPEVWMSTPVRLLLALSVACPALTDRVVRRVTRAR